MVELSVVYIDVTRVMVYILDKSRINSSTFDNKESNANMELISLENSKVAISVVPTV